MKFDNLVSAKDDVPCSDLTTLFRRQKGQSLCGNWVSCWSNGQIFLATDNIIKTVSYGGSVSVYSSEVRVLSWGHHESCNTRFPRPTWVCPQNGLSVFAQLYCNCNLHVIICVLHVIISQNPIISCLIQTQSGFAFLVLAYPGCPGKEAIKRV